MLKLQTVSKSTLLSIHSFIQLYFHEKKKTHKAYMKKILKK